MESYPITVKKEEENEQMEDETEMVDCGTGGTSFKEDMSMIKPEVDPLAGSYSAYQVFSIVALYIKKKPCTLFVLLPYYYRGCGSSSSASCF